jgi:Leucine-rich repeat (LRR) protein
LKHLRELKVDGNTLEDLDGIMQLASLVHLSVRNNRLTKLDLRQSHWRQCEGLDLANNCLVSIAGLDALV